MIVFSVLADIFFSAVLADELPAAVSPSPLPFSSLWLLHEEEIHTLHIALLNHRTRLIKARELQRACWQCITCFSDPRLDCICKRKSWWCSLNRMPKENHRKSLVFSLAISTSTCITQLFNFWKYLRKVRVCYKYHKHASFKVKNYVRNLSERRVHFP